MSTPLTRASNNKIGTCPHGMPMGACPMCNGMGGGAGGARRQPKAGELSWDQCYAIGQMMKAQKANAQHAKEHAVNMAQIAMLQNISDKIAAMRTAFLNAMPVSVVRVFEGLKSILMTPVSQLGQKLVNLAQTAISAVTKFVNTVKETLINIADKLVAVFGELKNAIEKKISDKFNELKKKAFNLFGLANVENADSEEDEEIKRLEEQSRNMELNETNEAVFDLKNKKYLRVSSLVDPTEGASGTEAYIKQR